MEYYMAAKNNVEFTMFSDYKELPPRMQEIMYKSCLTKTDLKGDLADGDCC